MFKILVSVRLGQIRLGSARFFFPTAKSPTAKSPTAKNPRAIYFNSPRCNVLPPVTNAREPSTVTTYRAEEALKRTAIASNPWKLACFLYQK